MLLSPFFFRLFSFHSISSFCFSSFFPLVLGKPVETWERGHGRYSRVGGGITCARVQWSSRQWRGSSSSHLVGCVLRRAAGHSPSSTPLSKSRHPAPCAPGNVINRKGITTKERWIGSAVASKLRETQRSQRWAFSTFSTLFFSLFLICSRSACGSILSLHTRFLFLSFSLFFYLPCKETKAIQEIAVKQDTGLAQEQERVERRAEKEEKDVKREHESAQRERERPRASTTEHR